MNSDNEINTETNSIQKHLNSYIVGVSGFDLPFSLSQEASLIAAHMASQAQQYINIITRHLDRKIYNNHGFCQAVTSLIKKNPKAEIHILLHDPSDALHHNHSLIKLYQKLDSFITIKRIHEEFKSYNHAYLSVDHTAVIYREHADLYEGIANYNDKLLAKNLRMEFTKIWDLSEPEHQFRNLRL